jgi:hypothetical protein
VTTTEFETEDFGRLYHDAVNEFKAMWPNYRNVVRELAEPINKMINVVFEVHPEWSVRRVINTIAADLSDLKGFSVRHLYRFLDHENRARIYKKGLPDGTTELLETDQEESSRRERERQENEESAKNVSSAYGIDSSKESPMQLKGHTRCLEKQQLLRDELYAVKGQMKHYKKFFERGEVILEPDVLEEIGILLKSSPDKIIITHERMHAVGARAKGVNELVKKGSEVHT